MNCKVSIIVPIYNVEKYLKRAVDSIIAQTHKNIEILLVDDGSPDSCGDICDEYALNDNRIIVIHKKNGGLSSARNAGIEKATGKYILFVDSDDYILPNMVERLLNVAYNNCDIVQCDFFRFEDKIPESPLKKDFEVITSKSALNRIDSAEYMAAWNKLYIAELFDDIRFPDGKIHEDVGCTYKLFYKAQKIAIIKDKLYGYFTNPCSITTSKIKSNKLDLIDAYIGQVRFFNEKGLKENSKRANNNLAACFGTFLSYKKERYENYPVFLNQVQNIFSFVRKDVILKNSLRIDLKIVTLLSFGNVGVMKFYHKIKSLIKK